MRYGSDLGHKYHHMMLLYLCTSNTLPSFFLVLVVVIIQLPGISGQPKRNSVEKRIGIGQCPCVMKTLLRKRIWLVGFPREYVLGSKLFLVQHLQGVNWVGKDCSRIKLCHIFKLKILLFCTNVYWNAAILCQESSASNFSVFLEFCGVIHLTCKTSPLLAYGLNSLCFSKSLRTFLISSCKNVAVSLCLFSLFLCTLCAYALFIHLTFRVVSGGRSHK